MIQKIYMDHAATTDLLPEARAAMEPYLAAEFGNASTSYGLGREARRAVEAARSVVAESIGADPDEIFFTSGGSESDNWALKGAAAAGKGRGRHIITSQVEHHAVLHSCAYLEKLHYRCSRIPVDAQGVIRMDLLKQAAGRGTTVISVMYGNNEIGTIQPIREIGEFAGRRGIVFHTDAVQAVGQVPIRVHELPVDLLSASGHKFHGPKGVGFLYVRKGTKLPSFIHGGAQENERRAGTENVAGIVGMAEALQIAESRIDENMKAVTALREELVRGVLDQIPDTRYNGHPICRLPGNASFSFRGVEASALLVLLEEEGICASAASACSTGQTSISHVIRAIRVPDDYARGTVRLTLGRDNTREQVRKCVRCLKESVELLRGE